MIALEGEQNVSSFKSIPGLHTGRCEPAGESKLRGRTTAYPSFYTLNVFLTRDKQENDSSTRQWRAVQGHTGRSQAERRKANRTPLASPHLD